MEEIKAEVVLLGWSTTDKGHTCRLLLDTMLAEAHPFVGLHIGAEHGQRFTVTFTPIEE